MPDEQSMNRLMRLTRAAACGVYKYTGAMYLHEQIARAAGRQSMTILLFHRVTDDIPEDSLTVGVGRFRTLCKMLSHNFRVVPLAEVYRIFAAGEKMPRRTVAITFDDCYYDNLRAARILAEFGMPATFFMPTDYVGTDRIFDWDRHLPKMPNLTWDDVGEMSRLGFEIGSHTASHANMGTVTPEQARYELVESKRVLQDRLGKRVDWFAYPFGGRDHLKSDYIPMIREAGYVGALSAFGGHVRPGIDARVLPREAVPYFRSVLHFEAYLSGCLDWIYSLKGKGAEVVLEPRPWPYGDIVPSDSVIRRGAGSLCTTGPV